MLGVYTAVLAIALLPAAALARRIGDAHVGAAGMALFCARLARLRASDSLGLLLVLRGVQALGGAGALVAAFELLDGGSPGPGRRMWVAASRLRDRRRARARRRAHPGLRLAGDLPRPGPDRAARAAGRAWPRRRGSRAGPSPRARPSGGPSRFRPAIALALLSASLTAVIFLVVLLLVSGWSIEPLAAALAVSVLPVAALSHRGSGATRRRARSPAACWSPGGVGCLALLPAASAWWTVIPQVLAGAGMGTGAAGARRAS